MLIATTFGTIDFRPEEVQDFFSAGAFRWLSMDGNASKDLTINRLGEDEEQQRAWQVRPQ